eukprot:maker-scaffold58_size443543-snap-gene-2.12 protein:Tk00699 transcript:maker-scaffold58_size443543-snap-gene-2.12-mRNA-1 annotation:"gamma-glutamyltranspeptidase 1"
MYRLELKKALLIMGSLGTLLVVATICVSLGFGVRSKSVVPTSGEVASVPTLSQESMEPRSKRVPPSPSPMGKYSMAAVAIDGKPCAQVGVCVLGRFKVSLDEAFNLPLIYLRDVMVRNGTAVDAAIAALLCDGLYNAQSMGIGGGFLMTIYTKETGEVITLNAREMAPKLAHPNMYEGNQEQAQRGPLAIAVPGELKGYWEAKQRYGNPDVSWSSLLQPSIDMCRAGIKISFSLAKPLASPDIKELIFKDPGMSKVFVNPDTNDTWKEGDFYHCNDLADTLERIAEFGAEDFYTGEIARSLVQDIQDAGGIISMEDLADYEVKWEPAVKVKVGSNTVHSAPLPGSGAVLAYIMNIMSNYDVKPEDDQPIFYHRLAEAFKFAYAVRSHLGDPSDPDIAEDVLGIVQNMTSDSLAYDTFTRINDSFTVNYAGYYGAEYSTPEDHGTAHCSVVSTNGDAVTVTSTINLEFGSTLMSPSTGIILNDEMDDFSYPNITNNFGVPPSANNFVKPGKRPLSSMSPTIVLDDAGNVKLVVGAAGGTRITTSIAYTSMRNLWFQETIKEAIDARRIHHQLAPMELNYEVDTPEDLVQFLGTKGHTMVEKSLGKSVVCGISRDEDGNLYANADFRKAGGVAGF